MPPPEGASPAPLPKRDPRVLVVEDEPRLRELLLKVIGGWGFDVSAVRSGEEALRTVSASDASESPDILVLDLNLPGMDGMDALRRLRERLPAVQAVVLTGFASLEAARQAIHLDVVEFLTKPCHLGELEQSLDRAARRLAPAAPPTAPALPDSPAQTGGMTLEEVERRHILDALARNGGNRTATAAELGISRRTLYYKIAEYQRQGFSVD